MPKDPAVNWYFDNWGGGTKTLSRFLKGCYIDLLDAQFHNGHLSLDEIKHVLGADFSAWQTLQKKFQQDVHGNYFNGRLDHEIKKREANSKKQSEKVKKRWDQYHSINNGNTVVIPNNENGIETGSFEKSEKLFFDLTTTETKDAMEYVDRVAQKRFTENEIQSFWIAFKLQYSKDFYVSRVKVIQHLKDWLKKQKINEGLQKTFNRRQL